MSTVSAPPPVERASADTIRARRTGVGLAALAGIVTIGCALAVTELLARLAAWAGLADVAASPFDSLGAAFITITPEWLKSFGIGLFGQNDKVALAVAMVVTFLLLGAIVGWIGRISPGAALAVAAGLVVITGIAIITRPEAGTPDLVPLVIGGGAGLALLHAIFRTRYDETPGWGAGLAARSPGRPALDVDAAADSGTVIAPDSSIGNAADSRIGMGVDPAPGERRVGPAASPAAPNPGRRRALQFAGLGALAAAAAGVLSRLIPAPVDVQAERAAVTLPPIAPDTATQGAGTAQSSPTTAPTTAPGTGATGTGAQPRAVVIPPALPYGANPDVADLTPFATDASAFYRVDTAFVPPRVATDTWQLNVHGLVRHPFQLTWAELLAMPQIARWVTLACVSNEVGGDLVGNAAWQGVRLADLLTRAEPQEGADCVYSTSADGFTVTTPLDALTDGRDALLAIGMNGAPLPVEHGFPARLVVPGLYGYVSATKWVVDLEVTRFVDATAYWTERGWSARGPIKTSSRIDTPHYGVSVKSGVVPVAGVAWAQHRGISGVQVQVDDGPWVDAVLSPAASADTWVQWVYRWDTGAVPPGSHRLTCRAIDGTGAVQVGTPSSVAPDGATGYHTINVVTS